MRALTSLAAALPLLAAAAGAPAGYAPLSGGAVCSRTQVVNVIPRLPRFSLLAQPVSADLGSYRLFDCAGSNASRACSAHTGFLGALADAGGSPASLTAALGSAAVRGTVVDYAQGVAWYSLLNLALALLIPLCTALVICGRYCCCCCGPSRCSCLRCGVAWPTRRGLCCGFRELKDGTIGYPCWERACTYALMLAFIGFASACVVLGCVYGGYGLTAGTGDMLGEADGLAALVQAALPPLLDFVIDASSAALAPALLALNTSLAAAVSLPATAAALACVNGTLYSLPNVTAALGFIAALRLGTGAIAGNASALGAQLQQLRAQRDALAASVGVLQGDVGALGASFGALTPALGATSGALRAVSAQHAALLDAPGGLARTARADLLTMPRAGAGGGFPDVSTLQAASGVPGDYFALGTMQRLVGRNLNGDAAEIGTLVARLRAVWSALRLPGGTIANYSATGVALRAIAGRVALAREQLVPALRRNLSVLATAVALVPAGASVNAHLLAVNASVDALQLAPVRASVASIGAVIAALPSFDALLGELQHVRSLPGVLPCLRTLSDQLAALNATIVALPSALSSLGGLHTSLNATITDAIASVDGSEAQIRAANASIAAVNISGYSAQLDDMSRQLLARRAEFNVTTFSQRLLSLQSGTAALNFTDVNATVDALAGALAGVNVTDLEVAAAGMEAWAATTGSLAAQLERMVAPATGSAVNPSGDYVLFARAFCTGNTQFYCDVSADCVVGGIDHGPCNTAAAGTVRCSAGAQATPCDEDVDCAAGGAGVFCLASYTRSQELLTSLLGAQDPSLPPDVASAVAGVTSLLASAGTLDPGAPLADMDAAQASATALDLSAASETLGTLLSSLALFDATAVNATLESVQAQIAAVPFATVQDQVGTLQSTVDDLIGTYRPLVRDAHGLVESLRGLLYDELPIYLAHMSRANLGAKLRTGGPSVMLDELTADVADRATRYLATSQQLLSVPTTSLESTADTYTVYMDRAAGAPATYPDTTTNGAPYYFGMLLSPDKMVAASDALAKYIYADRSGAPYADGKMCLTKACLVASLAVINSGGLSTWATAFPQQLGALPAGVPLTREHILLALWLPAVIAILLSVWALLPCCCRSSGWRKVPASCAAGCMICQLPCLFIITALVWPLVMVIGDGCASGANIGVNLMTGYGDAVCPLAGGVGSASACAYSVALPVGANGSGSSSISTTADFGGLYQSLMTKCPANDPLARAFAGVASDVAPLPYSVAHSYLSGAASLPIAPREGVLDIIYNATNVTGALLATLITRESSEALSCGRLNGVVGDIKAAVCCDLLSPVFWFVSAWYLLAWSMCLCGLPAACLGRKRFPKEPWGPAYEDSLAIPLALMQAPGGGAPKRGPASAYDASGEVDGGVFVPVASDPEEAAYGDGGAQGHASSSSSGTGLYDDGGAHRGSINGSRRGAGGRASGGGRRKSAARQDPVDDESDFSDHAGGGGGGWGGGGGRRSPQRGAVPVQI